MKRKPPPLRPSAESMAALLKREADKGLAAETMSKKGEGK